MRLGVSGGWWVGWGGGGVEAGAVVILEGWGGVLLAAMQGYWNTAWFFSPLWGIHLNSRGDGRRSVGKKERKKGKIYIYKIPNNHNVNNNFGNSDMVLLCLSWLVYFTFIATSDICSMKYIKKIICSMLAAAGNRFLCDAFSIHYVHQTHWVMDSKLHAHYNMVKTRVNIQMFIWLTTIYHYNHLLTIQLLILNWGNNMDKKHLFLSLSHYTGTDAFINCRK